MLKIKNKKFIASKRWVTQIFIKNVKILINNNEDNDEKDKLIIILLKKSKKVVKKFLIYVINENQYIHSSY